MFTAAPDFRSLFTEQETKPIPGALPVPNTDSFPTEGFVALALVGLAVLVIVWLVVCRSLRRHDASPQSR